MTRFLFAALGATVTLGVLLALPPRQPAPKSGVVRIPTTLPVAAEDPPDPIYTLPPDELAPSKVELINAAADVADWGHGPLAVAEAWKVARGKGVVVAVLDTGCDFEHRDLKTQIKGSKNFTSSRAGASDIQGHGSHCAGVIAAAENGTGMIGVAPEAQLLVGKVLGDSGSGSSSGIAAGIDWATEQGADVISMSLSGPAPDRWTGPAVRRANTAGVIVVAAAGNEGPQDGTVGYPSGYPEVICVGAVDSQLRVASFSSRGHALFIAAPGVNVRSCYPGDRFATMSGTSMATPYIAGVAALWVAAHPRVPKKDRPAAFKKALQESAKDLPPDGRDRATGYGLVQPAKMLTSGSPPPPVPPVKRPLLNWDDLTPEAQKRLKDAGLDPSKLD